MPTTSSQQNAFRYSPPGDIDDLAGRQSRSAFMDGWHRWLSGQFSDQIKELRKKPDSVEDPLFFSEVNHIAQKGPVQRTWNAFPLAVDRKYGHDKEGWAVVDQLGESDRGLGDSSVNKKFRRQDEYCEWHFYDRGEKNARIMFTAEGPEYWIRLAEHDLDRVVELYHDWVSPKVTKESLLLKEDIGFGGEILRAGTYDPFNSWNTDDGVMHLTHPANTLGAELNLAARATVLRRDRHGNRITEIRSLISSSGYGDANRSSDPSIGLGVNLTVLPDGADKANSVTLANPVGLYMDSLQNEQLIKDADAQPLTGWFTFVRGEEGHGLMARFGPPPGDNRTLDDVRVRGQRLTSGAQIAQLIQMAIYAASADLGKPVPALKDPVEHACVLGNVDLSDLADDNLLAGLPADLSCKRYGQKSGVELKDAYPDVFSSGADAQAAFAAAPPDVPPASRALTRNA